MAATVLRLVPIIPRASRRPRPVSRLRSLVTLVLCVVSVLVALLPTRLSAEPAPPALDTARTYFADDMEGNFLDTHWRAAATGGTAEYTRARAFRGAVSLHLGAGPAGSGALESGPEMRATQWSGVPDAPGYAIAARFYVPKAEETAVKDDAFSGMPFLTLRAAKETWASFAVESVSGASATIRVSTGRASESRTVTRGEWHALLVAHLEQETRPVWMDGKLWLDLGARPEVVSQIALGGVSSEAAAGSGEIYLDDLLFAPLAPNPEMPAVTYVVNPQLPTADDKNPGTAQKPLRTIGRAAELAGPGDTVLIEPGTYREWVALARSGTRLRPITFQAAKPGSVILTGADPLTGWTREPGDRPLYSVAWAHDFIINTNPDGSKVRHHMADAPVGCAEEIVCNGRPLNQVMKPESLQPGAFYVDWEQRRLTVWLPGGQDPNAVEMLGGTRGLLFSPLNRWNQWSKAEYITVRGLIFRYASNFAQRGMVHASRGWRVEDCVVEWANGSGLDVDGDGITLLRVTAQHNGSNGFGGKARDLTVRDCVLRWNNRKGFPPSNEGGGCKFVGCDGVRIENLRSYENTGPGLWFDWDNTNLTITGCTIYGNHGLVADWEGIGIFLEACPGPSRVTNNLIYSNTGAGIGLAESQKATLLANTLVDNGTNLEFRAMEGRANHRLEEITVRDNRLKAARGSALTTSLGTWSVSSPADKILHVDGNTYDQPAGKPLFRWAGQDLSTLADVRRTLGLERDGAARSFRVRVDLVPSVTLAKQRDQSIEKAIGAAAEGATVAIPVNGRTALVRGAGGWSCSVFDLANRYVTLQVPPAMKALLESRVSDFPRSEWVMLKVKLTRTGPEGTEASLLGWGEGPSGRH